MTYTWGMVVGLIGACRHFLRTERRGARYLADASYWMYLMHLPLLVVTHRAVSGLGRPRPAPSSRSWSRSSPPCCWPATSGFCVRHTVIGRVLHGPRPPRMARLPVLEPSYTADLICGRMLAGAFRAHDVHPLT